MIESKLDVSCEYYYSFMLITLQNTTYQLLAISTDTLLLKGHTKQLPTVLHYTDERHISQKQ